MTDFAALLEALDRNVVEYIVVGGAAAIAHGSARFTQDLDVVYRRTPENLDRLVAALKDLKPYLRGAPPGLPFFWDRTTLLQGLNFTSGAEFHSRNVARPDRPARRNPRWRKLGRSHRLDG